MKSSELHVRTKEFALRIMKLVDALPPSPSGRVIGNQICRSGTSIGANYRSAKRGRSKAEFIAKLGVAEEEADECCYWLELIIDGHLLSAERVQPLLNEANEITAMLAASRITAKSNREAVRRSQLAAGSSPHG